MVRYGPAGGGAVVDITTERWVLMDGCTYVVVKRTLLPKL